MIKTWNQRCEEHPDHQNGMVSERMIQARMQEEIDDLRAALEQPEQEPVAWIQPDHLQKARRAPFLCRVEPTKRMSDFVPLYTISPAAQRKPLTDAQIDDFRVKNSEGRGAGWRFSFKGFARDIEAAHGIGEKP